MAATSGASAEPQAAVATKQPESWVNFMPGVVNVTDAIGETCPQGSTVRTPTAYCVPGFRFGDGDRGERARAAGLHLRRASRQSRTGPR